MITKGLREIKAILDQSKYVIRTTLIESAIVPVLKVDFELNYFNRKGIHTKNNSLVLNVDLSFKADGIHNGDTQVDLINFFKNKNKMLIPVTLVIKRLLMLQSLNSS